MKFLSILALLGAMTLMACNADAPSNAAGETPSTNVQAPGANTGTVYHYTCPNNCENGGSDTQGACPGCGAQLAHNQEWHNLPQNQPAQQPQQNPISPVIQNPQQPAQQQPEPAQNAAGVWHYTCSNGCAGGSGSQGTCSKCGAALAHNQAYHQ
jgi:hypothetical protein